MSLKLKTKYKFVETEMLERIFLLQNPSNMRRCNDHMIDQLIDMAPDNVTVVRSRGSVLMRKGKARGKHPHFLAHLDQVHDYAPFMELAVEHDKHDRELLCAYDANDHECGVGGDDKCGIYLAMIMLHKLPHVTVVFVRDEEVGCEGSSEVPLSWFKHASFVIQSDRNNYTMDIISDTNGMKCASDSFMESMLALPTAIEAGHSENTGSITDIGELASRGLNVSMVNISSGYHNAHTPSEFVDLYELDVSIRLAYDAATTLGDRKWENHPTSTWRSYSRKASRWSSPAYSLDQLPSESPVQNALFKLDNQEEDYSPSDDYPFSNHESYSREETIVGLEEFGYDRIFDGLDTFDDKELEDCVSTLGYQIRIVR